MRANYCSLVLLGAEPYRGKAVRGQLMGELLYAAVQ